MGGRVVVISSIEHPSTSLSRVSGRAEYLIFFRTSIEYLISSIEHHFELKNYLKIASIFQKINVKTELKVGNSNSWANTSNKSIIRWETDYFTNIFDDPISKKLLISRAFTLFKCSTSTREYLFRVSSRIEYAHLTKIELEYSKKQFERAEYSSIRVLDHPLVETRLCATYSMKYVATSIIVF